jgi:Uma2 family endonuclease
VEVISDSETEPSIGAKIRDYAAIGVREFWRIWPATQTVEILDLTRPEFDVVAIYHPGDTAQSLTFPDLTVPVDDLFTDG